MIKDHGALGLSPSTCLELLEKHFGDAFRNAKIEPRDISNLYYKHGYKAATDCHELVRRLREKQKDPRWVVEVEKEPGTNRLTHLFWMTPSQVEAASRFNYLVIHDNTYNCNMFFHLQQQKYTHKQRDSQPSQSSHCPIVTPTSKSHA